MSSPRNTKIEADTPNQQSAGLNGVDTDNDTLSDKEIPNAFALVPGPGPGQWYAVHLRGARAREIVHLEPNERPSGAAWGMNRIHAAMDKLYRKRSWGM